METNRDPSSRVLPQIYVLDDSLEMCLSLEALIVGAGFQTAIFTSPPDWLERRRDLAPGVLLLDLRMPEMSGIDVLRAMRSDLPRFPTIVISAHGDIESAVLAIRLGARDFLQKPFRSRQLIEVIKRELAELRASSSKSGNPAPGITTLSPREREVALRLARGLHNREIADALGLSVRTVEMHRARAMQRLGCHSFADLLREVFRLEANSQSTD